MSPTSPSRPRVCAVSYLNTVPLVWGMLKGPQRDLFDLSFAVPSACAEEVRDRRADIGIVPVATLLEEPLEIFRGTGIASRGAVRSILLVSKKPLDAIQVIAADSGSRTSVMLSRVILSATFNVQPAILTMAPRLDAMLDAADAALVIGDAALLADPELLRARGLNVIDLGEEWMRLSGLPMVFAVWAGRASAHTPEAERVFIESCRFGIAHLDEIVAYEHLRRGITAALAKKYLTEHIVFELADAEYRGMQEFLKAAAALPIAHNVEPAEAIAEK